MSLFNRPAWAKSQTADLEDPEDNIFSHSNRSYQEIVAEQERKKKEKLERKKAKEERRSSKKREIKDEPTKDSSFKKRRITAEDSKALLSRIGLTTKTTGRSSGDGDSDSEAEVELPVRRSPRTNKHVDPVSPRKTRRQPQVVELGSSDDEDEQITYEPPQPKEAEAVEVQDESDDEFAELARRARLERQQKERNTKSQAPDIAVHSPTAGIDKVDTGQRSLPTPPPDPTVLLFITSPIPDTNPLLVHRKLSQRIQEIRAVWCKKQGFSAEMTKGVFFIYRMRRIYDATTCKSLGLDVDAFGNIIMKDAESEEGADRVHLEAVTEEVFEELKVERAKKAQRRSGATLPEDSAEAGAANDVGETQKQEDSIIRLTMKAKGMADFRLRVKPTTLVSKIVSAYRKSQHFDDDTTLSLEFDGDRLDPDDEVQNTEISDLDCIDVYVG